MTTGKPRTRPGEFGRLTQGRVTALQVLLGALVDDAGLFPPSSLSMADALARHRRSEHWMLSGVFLCPTDRVGELVDGLGVSEELAIHLVGHEAEVADLRITVRAVETRVPSVGELPGSAEHSPDRYVEGIPPAELHGTRLHGKVRCGGARIPPVEQLADYVTECVRLGVPFKATAGMHAAVRGWESTDGQPHHGYLNLLLAVSRALSGGDVEAVLASTDPEALAAEAKAIDLELAAATRGLFHSYGSCDTDRPIRDAEKLGLW